MYAYTYIYIYIYIVIGSRFRAFSYRSDKLYV